MSADQKTVAVGAASGVILMALSVYLLYQNIPMISGMDMALDRVIFTLRLNLLALVPLFVMLVTVGNERFLSKAIDPLRHAENQAMEVNGRVADNTLQQTFVFFVATLALSTYLTAESIKVIPALVTVFIVARVVFWVGYRIGPLYRAPGMAATAYMNVGIILTSLYFLYIS